MNTVAQIAILIVLWLFSMVTTGNLLNKRFRFTVRDFRGFIVGWTALWFAISLVVIM